VITQFFGFVDFDRPSGGADEGPTSFHTSSGSRFSGVGWAHAWMLQDNPSAGVATCVNCGATVLSAVTGRIDNRTHLVRALSGRHSDQPQHDAALLRAAYSEWGPACADLVDGDWVFAAFCRNCRRLDLLRDASGGSQLYYAAVDRFAAFSTDIRLLARFPGVPQALDELWIAKLLVGWADETEGVTAFRAIRRLPPGHRFSMGPMGGTLERYWSVDDVRTLVLDDDREYAEALKAALTAAVRARVQAPQIGTMLSAGLDSSAITALAARALAGQGRCLLALTHVPDSSGLGEPFDEGPAAAELLGALPGVHHLRLSSGEWSPVRALRRYQEIFGVPAFANTNAPLMCAILEQAQRAGVTSLLTGQVGNLTMEWGLAGAGVAALLRARRYREAVRRALPGRIRALWALRATPLGGTRSPWASKPIANSFADRLDLGRLITEAGRSPVTLIGRRRTSFEVLRIMAERSGAAYAQLGAVRGIAVLDPFMARPLIELVASVPARVWLGPQDRWLFRQAMVGVLPDRTRLRRWKGVQSADFARRLAEHPDALAALFDEVEQSALARHYVDVAWVRGVAATLMSDKGTGAATRIGGSWLMRALETALFLASLERGDWKPQPGLVAAHV
jgi:asparagine synthase (glutamine-hydrolysing)